MSRPRKPDGSSVDCQCGVWVETVSSRIIFREDYFQVWKKLLSCLHPPPSMCKEFCEKSPSAYQLLVQGLIGVSDMESISENRHLEEHHFIDLQSKL